MDRLLRLDLLEDTSQALRRNDSGPRRTWSTRAGNGVEYAGGIPEELSPGWTDKFLFFPASLLPSHP